MAASAGLALAATAPAQAATTVYEAILDDLSGLGGSGRADIVHDGMDNTLWVRIQGGGFAADQLHVQHIHGRFDDDGNPRDSVSPTLADDTDGDGVIELLEGLPRYGGILLSLFDEDEAGNAFDGFPSASNGIIDFTHTFDLDSTAALSDGVTAADLFPLELREIVVHGAFLEPGIGGIGNEQPGNDLLENGGYSAFVPVAAGEIRLSRSQVDPRMDPPAVPLPPAGFALMAGVAGLGALRARRKA
jgi:hypothetical protein